jgi:hypothetical protein
VPTPHVEPAGAGLQPLAVQLAISLHAGFGSLPNSHSRPTVGHSAPAFGMLDGHALVAPPLPLDPVPPLDDPPELPPPLEEPLEPPELLAEPPEPLPDPDPPSAPMPPEKVAPPQPHIVAIATPSQSLAIMNGLLEAETTHTLFHQEPSGEGAVTSAGIKASLCHPRLPGHGGGRELRPRREPALPEAAARGAIRPTTRGTPNPRRGALGLH